MQNVDNFKKHLNTANLLYRVFQNDRTNMLQLHKSLETV